MPIRAVVFDFGGVLVHLHDPSGRRKWESRLGLAKGDLERLVFDSEVSARATAGALSEAAVWEHVIAVLGLEKEQLAEFQADFWAGDGLEEEMVALLRSLRPRYKTAILSNAWRGGRETIAHTYGMHNLVDLIVISAEEGVAKPDPAIYQLTVDRLGVCPGEAIFVDDRAENVKGAQILGMVGIQYMSAAQVIAAIEKHLQ